MYAGWSVRHRYGMNNRRIAKKIIPRPQRRVYQPTFIRQWREDRNKTLEQLGELIGMSHVSLSRIERGLQPYSQPVLEAIAKALGTDPASLINHNPENPEIWPIWDGASQGDKRKIMEIAKTITGKTEN
jgi:transcriptional regulator with XRE-family HTH domain